MWLVCSELQESEDQTRSSDALPGLPEYLSLHVFAAPVSDAVLRQCYTDVVLLCRLKLIGLE